MCGIFNIPDEVLDKFLKELLPPLAGELEACFDSTVPLPVPTDLLCCRLVCRDLERRASPWAWRRAQIGHDGTSLKRGDSSIKFFSARPGLARHDRLLRIAQFKSRSAPLADPIFLDIQAALRLMSNLQAIVLHRIQHAELLTELLHKRHLHTAKILFCNLPTPMNMEPRGNIKHLAVQLREGVEDVLQITPRLESLQLYEESRPDAVFNPTTLSIPWETLREICICTDGFHGAALLRGISENFMTWKAHNLHDLSPLVEVYVHSDRSGISEGDINFILSAFKGQSLQKLRFSDVEGQASRDPTLVKRIADAFPRLTNLGLAASGVMSWQNRDQLCQMASILEGFQLLETVEWIQGWHFWNIDHADTFNQALDIVQIFAQRCPRLTQVKFPYWKALGPQGTALACRILRDDLGQYENCESHVCPDWQSIPTSSWHPSNHHLL